MRNVPDKIIVHHSADSSPYTQLSKINQYHKGRGFPESRKGYFVGYHYLIEHDGKITQTKDHDEEGAHTKGQNFRSIGICLAGEFDLDLPTAEQRRSLSTLLRKVCATCGISQSDVYPHRRFGETHCYGMRLTSDWAQIQGLIGQLNFWEALLVKAKLWLQNIHR